MSSRSSPSTRRQSAIAARMRASRGLAGFDSSWDLQRGLEVSERWFEDAGLCGWIEEFLRAQRTMSRTTSPSSSTAIA